MQFIKLLVFGLAAVLAVTAVQAQTSAVALAIAARAQTNAAAAFFQSADTNSDGRVCQAEFAGHVKKSTFDSLDVDKDDMISLEEWKAVDRSPEAHKNFKAMDKDRNGMISFREFSNVADWRSALNDSFQSLDLDRDSHLAPDELTGRPMFQLLSVNF
ncbi:MAG: EF-hand domain-containing protein [Verrucomicrobiota bacterium]